MKIKILLSALIVTGLVGAEDAPKPPTKKEFISTILHI